MGDPRQHPCACTLQSPAIRPARRQDKPRIEAIVREAYAVHVQAVGGEPAPMRDDYAALIAAGEVFVAEAGGLVVGLIVLKDEPGVLLLDNVAVHPQAQGLGLGKALVAFAEDEARRRKHPAVRLYTNVAMTWNRTFYARQGYVETHQCLDQGFHRVFLTKRLRPAASLPER